MSTSCLELQCPEELHKTIPRWAGRPSHKAQDCFQDGHYLRIREREKAINFEDKRMEMTGFEPVASDLRSLRSPS
jgi:hypothetical protein